MSSIVGEHADKWLDVIISFHGDPSKYSLPEEVFGLPDIEKQEVNQYLEIVRKKWNRINPTHTKPYDNLEEALPFWMVFTLSKRPSLLYLSVWDAYLEEKDRKLYQDIQYSFQELIQNYIREELGLFKLVRPFRKLTGSSVYGKKKDATNLSGEISERIRKYTSPQKIQHEIADFVRNKTLQSGIAFIMLLERFSELISKTKNKNQVAKVTKKFEEELARLENITFSPKIPTQTKTRPNKLQDDMESDANERIDLVEFERIELQEYDGYVEISGLSTTENRNFRIYNCIEEDLLREEMWKNRKYPLRRLIAQILDERYNRPTKEYHLAYGVEIEVLPPNWAS